MAEGAREGLIQDVNVIMDAWIPTRSINPLLFNHKGNLGDRAGFNVSLRIRRRCALNCTSRFYSGRRRVARPCDPSRRSSMIVVTAQHFTLREKERIKKKPGRSAIWNGKTLITRNGVSLSPVSSDFKLPVIGSHMRTHRNFFVTPYPRSERQAFDIARETRGTRGNFGDCRTNRVPATICMLTRRHGEFVAVSLRDNYQFLCRLFPYTNLSPLKLSTRHSSRPSGDSTKRRCIEIAVRTISLRGHARIIRLENAAEISYWRKLEKARKFSFEAATQRDSSLMLEILSPSSTKGNEVCACVKEVHIGPWVIQPFYFQVRLRNQLRVSTHPVFNRGSAVVLNTDASPLTTCYSSMTDTTIVKRKYFISYCAGKNSVITSKAERKIKSNEQWWNRFSRLDKKITTSLRAIWMKDINQRYSSCR